MVGKKRLELLNLSVLVPKTSAYTNSATCPYTNNYQITRVSIKLKDDLQVIKLISFYNNNESPEILP